jgi:hypothetical protein
MKPRPAFRLTILALAAMFALGACGDRSQDDADPRTTIDPGADAAPDGPPALEPPTMPAGGDLAAATQAAEVRVVDVELGDTLGDGNRVATAMTTFAPDDRIHASVRTDGDGGGMSARWLYQDGQVVRTEELKVAAGPQVSSFRIDNPEPWPAGTYTLEIMVDGQVVQTREFEVR